MNEYGYMAIYSSSRCEKSDTMTRSEAERIAWNRCYEGSGLIPVWYPVNGQQVDLPRRPHPCK